MRRLTLFGLSVLTMVFMAVSPALADDRDGDGWDEDFGFWVLVPVFVEYDVDFDDIDDFGWYDDFYYWDDWGHHHNWDRDRCEGPVCLID